MTTRSTDVGDTLVFTVAAVLLALIIAALLLGCGGAPFELQTDSFVGIVDAQTEAAEAAATSVDAGEAADVDAAYADAADVVAVDSREDAREVDAPVADTLCCVRSNGAALCIDQPWYCCLGDTCGGEANCTTRWADGGPECQAGAVCGLLGSTASGVVGRCPQ